MWGNAKKVTNKAAVSHSVISCAASHTLYVPLTWKPSDWSSDVNLLLSYSSVFWGFIQEANWHKEAEPVTGRPDKTKTHWKQEKNSGFIFERSFESAVCVRVGFSTTTICCQTQTQTCFWIFTINTGFTWTLSYRRLQQQKEIKRKVEWLSPQLHEKTLSCRMFKGFRRPLVGIFYVENNPNINNKKQVFVENGCQSRLVWSTQR